LLPSVRNNKIRPDNLFSEDGLHYLALKSGNGHCKKSKGRRIRFARRVMGGGRRQKVDEEYDASYYYPNEGKDDEEAFIPRVDDEIASTFDEDDARKESSLRGLELTPYLPVQNGDDPPYYSPIASHTNNMMFFPPPDLFDNPKEGNFYPGTISIPVMMGGGASGKPAKVIFAQVPAFFSVAPSVATIAPPKEEEEEQTEKPQVITTTTTNTVESKQDKNVEQV
jgi:hypothetical protein